MSGSLFPVQNWSGVVASALILGLICSGAIGLNSAAWAKGLETVYSVPLVVPPAAARTTVSVHGRIFGRPFAADDAYINSCSLILKQNHKIYCKVVLSFLALQTIPADHEFFSRGKVQPRIDISQRLKNDEKLRSQTFEAGKQNTAYALHVKFGPRFRGGKPDTTAGAINLRFADGDYLEGTFVAKQSPRLIWDDQSIID